MAKVTPIKIEIDWDAYLSPFIGRDPETGESMHDGKRSVEDIIVDRAAHIVADRLIQDETRYKSLPEQARLEMVKLLEGKVQEITEGVLNTPRQRTDGWGNPSGKPTTLADEVTSIVERRLNAEIATGRDYNSPKTTVIRKTIEDLTGREIAKQVKEAVDAEKDLVIQKVTAQAASVLTEGMKRAVEL